MDRYIIGDESDIRKRIREFIKFYKKKTNLADIIASDRFLLEINREITSYLQSRGVKRARKRHYKKHY